MSDINLEKQEILNEEQNVATGLVEDTDYEPQEDGNILMAIVGGLISSVVVASLWALITVSAEKQWAIMAIFAGLAVGCVVHHLAKGRSLQIAIIGGFFALLSCVLGDFFTNVGFIARYEEMEYFTTLSLIDFSLFFEITFAEFDFISLLFYGIASYEGFVICNSKNSDSSDE